MTKEDAMDYLARCADESDPEYAAAVALAVSALRAQVEAERNDPLTMEQLCEMRGESAWCVELEEYGIVKMDCIWPPRVKLVLVTVVLQDLDGTVSAFKHDIVKNRLTLYRHKPTEKKERIK